VRNSGPELGWRGLTWISNPRPAHPVMAAREKTETIIRLNRLKVNDALERTLEAYSHTELISGPSSSRLRGSNGS